MSASSSILFYLFAAIAIAGSLAAALLPTRERRGLGLLALAVGLAGLYAVLSAGFAAAVALVAYLGTAAILSSPVLRRRGAEPAAALTRQLGAVAAALVFAALAYVAFRGDFFDGGFHASAFGSAALGRLLITRDGLGADALGAIALIVLAAAAVSWRARGR